MQTQPAQPSPADQSLLDQSAGRRRWGSNSGPLFPGYEEDTPVRSKVREPEAVTQDQQPLFQPPSESIVSEHINDCGRGLKLGSRTVINFHISNSLKSLQGLVPDILYVRMDCRDGYIMKDTVF